MTALLQKRFENFLICVVVNNQSKIQLRQTVLDKIKLDFLTKYPNKLVVLSEPTRDTPKSRESWANFCDRVIEISLETMEIAFDQLNESVRQETIEKFGSKKFSNEIFHRKFFSIVIRNAKRVIIRLGVFAIFSYYRRKLLYYMNLLACILMPLFNMMNWTLC